LYDAETVVESRVRLRKFGTSKGEASPLQGGVRVHFARYAAGIGMAGFYARYLYGRLPGPPLVQGMTYAMLEFGTQRWGGPGALLQRVAPELRIAPGYTAPAAITGEPLHSRALRHVAFGLALGLVYRGN
jgi:hypothetical protein